MGIRNHSNIRIVRGSVGVAGVLEPQNIPRPAPPGEPSYADLLHYAFPKESPFPEDSYELLSRSFDSMNPKSLKKSPNLSDPHVLSQEIYVRSIPGRAKNESYRFRVVRSRTTNEQLSGIEDSIFVEVTRKRGAGTVGERLLETFFHPVGGVVHSMRKSGPVETTASSTNFFEHLLKKPDSIGVKLLGHYLSYLRRVEES
jgi:hypothetical protein